MKLVAGVYPQVLAHVYPGVAVKCTCGYIRSPMDFKTHFFALSVDARKALAESAGTTAPYLTQVAYGNKKVELGFADVLVTLCPGVSHGDLPLTENAKRQRLIRDSAPEKAGA